MDIILEENGRGVFKSYLRRLLQDLKDLRKEMEKTNNEKLIESLTG